MRMISQRVGLHADVQRKDAAGQGPVFAGAGSLAHQALAAFEERVVVHEPEGETLYGPAIVRFLERKQQHAIESGFVRLAAGGPAQASAVPFERGCIAQRLTRVLQRA